MLDPKIVISSALAGLMIVVPAVVIFQVISDGGGTSSRLLYFGLVILGFVIAGFGGGRQERSTPLMHGAAAGAAVYVVIQLVGLVLRLVNGESINVIQYAFLLLLASTAGVLGAMFADWSIRKGMRR